ncbi:MAG: ABC transporter permease, partial [Actinomycetota bacterium]|nr:ABC transporter permease [Actinomycetota bacterium]
NAAALDANEVRSSRIVLLVMVVAGALAGLAGVTETAGVNTSHGAEASVGYGWEAVIVALLGRLHPIGVLAAGLGLAGMTIGFEVAQRTYDLPSSLIGVITALLVVFVVVGDALAVRLRERR